MKIRNGIEYEVVRSGVIRKEDGKSACSICLRLRRVWIQGSRFVQRTYIGGDGSIWFCTEEQGDAIAPELVPVLDSIGLKTALEFGQFSPESEE